MVAIKWSAISCWKIAIFMNNLQQERLCLLFWLHQSGIGLAVVLFWHPGIVFYVQIIILWKYFLLLLYYYNCSFVNLLELLLHWNYIHSVYVLFTQYCITNEIADLFIMNIGSKWGEIMIKMSSLTKLGSEITDFATVNTASGSCFSKAGFKQAPHNNTNRYYRWSHNTSSRLLL
jgi:hypothetical protein